MPINTPATEGLSDDGGQPVEYIDDPLDPVAQDNIDIDIQIGPARDGLDGTNAPQNSFSYLPTEIEIHITDGPEASYAMGYIVPEDHNRKPSVPADAALDDGLLDSDVIAIDVDNELTEVRDDTDGEITRVFTGIVSNSSRVEHGLYEFMAFQPGYENIQNAAITISGPPTGYQEVEIFGKTYKKPVYNERRQYASILADDIAQAVIDGTPFSYTFTILDDAPVNIGDVKYGEDQQLFMNSSFVPLSVEGKDEGALQRVVNATNTVWEIDRYGDFHIGPPVPDNEEYAGVDYPTKVTSHKLRYITETSAGIQSPAWRSIVVIGDGVVSQDGWGATAQVNENPQQFFDVIDGERQATADQFGPEVRRDELVEPTFEYVNLEIQTASEARKALERIKDKILKQRGNGEITVVGHPEIWPGDAIELPDTKNQPYGLERFGVGKVVHRINNQDGFLTKINVTGMTRSNEATFAEDVPVPDDDERYESSFAESESAPVSITGQTDATL
jgi:hypothetical protein